MTMAGEPARILVLTGTVGSGKTTVAVEIGRLLEAAGERCAIVDLDWLGWVYAGESFREYDRLMLDNLAAVWPNFAALGISSLVVARAFLRNDAVGEIRARFPSAAVTVIRLRVAAETIRHRLALRDSGAVLAEHLEEAASMDAAIDAAAIEHASVVNDGAPVEAVACEVLALTGWR